ncbi:MAG: pilus assembly PilX N-terminal domain-containing protein [Actinomycetota bacterium]|nr:pilus assembly PilX N-terminal domain-containing protein [Actinomycetota bacterium]
MIRLRRSITRGAEGDSGSAMIVTLLVMAVLTGLGAVVFNVGYANLQNSGRDRLAGSALGASEGGVAQAIAFIRNQGVTTLTCPGPVTNTSNACTTNDWGSNNQHVVNLSGGRQFKVWVQQVIQFNPPTNTVGSYIVHAEGTAGAGPGKRSIEETLKVKPLQFPIGIYTDAGMADAGGAAVHRESVYSKDCIVGRNAMTIDGTDTYTGNPAAAHSVKYITAKQNSGCTSNDPDNEHKPSSPPNVPADYCNLTYKLDQDSQGGTLAGTACAGVGGAYPQTSLFTQSDLNAAGYRGSRGLTLDDYAALKSRAIEIGQYYTTTSFTPPDPTLYPNAVMYFKIAGGTVNIQGGDVPGYTVSFCGSRSLVLVVEGGDLHLNSNVDLVAAIFVPDGNYQGNGTGQIEGTLFAKTIDKLNGTQDFYLDNCFLKNLPGGLLDVSPDHFRQVDR